MAQSTIQTRLCPHCANSIGADALKCPYCKAELSPMPQWPEREERPVRFVQRAREAPLTVKSKAILALGLLVFALGVYLVGAQQQRSDLRPMLAVKQQQLEERDEKLKNLEAELADCVRNPKAAATTSIKLTRKLKATESELAATRSRLAAANREIDRCLRPVAPRRDPRASESGAGSQRGAARRRCRTLKPCARPTVFEGPATSARILSRINKGTQVNVVRSASGWFEIRSTHGNPGGFIRADDVTLVSRAN